MKINWLWDSRLMEREVRKILKDENNPRFDIYAEKLFSRINNPKIAFNIIDKRIFYKKWPSIRKQIEKDAWLKEKVVFWETIYKQLRISPERRKVAEQIKKIRVKLGLTQKELASKLNVIQQYISKIENGRENFSIDALAKVAEVLKMKLDIRFKAG